MELFAVVENFTLNGRDLFKNNSPSVICSSLEEAEQLVSNFIETNLKYYDEPDRHTKYYIYKYRLNVVGKVLVKEYNV